MTIALPDEAPYRLHAAQPLRRSAGGTLPVHPGQSLVAGSFGAVFLALGLVVILMLAMWALRARRATLLVLGLLALFTINAVAGRPTGRTLAAAGDAARSRQLFLGGRDDRIALLRAGLAPDHRRQGVRVRSRPMS